MSVLDKVLALRPTVAATRLGGSRVPVLNPRDLARALGSGPSALLVVPLTCRSAAAGLLRAARDMDAPLGLSCPYPLGGRDSAHRFFEAAREAAEEVRHRRPLFLEAGPLTIASADSVALERAAAEVFRFVDAGFGLVSLDAAALGVDEAVEGYRQAAQPAMERELSLEVACPVVADRASPEALRELLDALQRVAVPVRFVRVESRAMGVELSGTNEWALDTPLLEAVRQAAQAAGADTSVDERGALSMRWAAAWIEAGVKKIRAHDTFGRIVVGSLPKPVAQSHAAEAAQAGETLEAWLGRAQEALAALDIRARERIEALWYGEASDLMASMGCEGAGSRAVQFLAAQGGY